MRAARISATIGRRAACWAAIIGLTAIAGTAWPGATETAVANGDTRTINLYHAHTHESITATYMVDGQYDPAVLDKLNWFLRDWRRDEPTKMEPRLFDIVWQVYRESGSQQPIEVMSAYRSPETNAMLRRRSRGVAEHSQHILGRAMDQHYMDVPMSRIRELGMKLQRGGVGFYPTAGTPFVHLDAGGVRHWPRMSYDQLVRLFPDGKTVHIPSNGQPLPGYEEARAELEARGDGSYPTASEVKSKGFFAWLFGGGGDEEEDNESAGVRATARAPQQRVASLSRTVPGAVPEIDSYGKNDRASNMPDSGFLKPAAPPLRSTAQAPASQPPASQPVIPPPPAPPSVPQPDAQQALARAMLAQEANGAAQPPVASVTALPVGGEVLERLDPAHPPSAPLPPRRPVELAALGPETPMPMPRPPELSGTVPHDMLKPAAPPSARADPLAALIEGRQPLPEVITRGTPPPRPSAVVLGYAQPVPDAAHAPGSPSNTVPFPIARPASLVSTTLDRSNFRTLTRPDNLDRSASRSALGATIAPIRAASRSRIDALVPMPTVRPTTFQSRATDLTTDRFSGLAGKTPPRQATRLE